MKKLIAALMIVTVGAFSFANGDSREDMHGDRDMERHIAGHDMFEEEARDIVGEFSDRSPASLTFGEMNEIAMALSVPAQKAAYVRASAISSAIMPGLGQFKNGDALSGSLFMLADLVVAAGTSVGIYYLLPPELRFDQLDYFNSTRQEIRDAWTAAEANATFADSWPIVAAATGGVILKHVVSHLSARHAGQLAMERIESGEVTFEPRAGFMMGHRGPGVGFSLRY